jgi:hypothetical protein
VAATAANDLVNSNAIAGPHFCDGCADVHDLSSDFMAEYKRRSR